MNTQIAVVKSNKYGQYQQYQEWLAYQAELERIAREKAMTVAFALSGLMK